MSAFHDKNTIGVEQSFSEFLFTASTENPSPVALATRMPIAYIVIRALLIDSLTAVTMGTKLEVYFITNRITPVVWSCR